MPATGFGMGDVVLANLLEEAGKLPKNTKGAIAPDVFVVNALPATEAALRLTGDLRAIGLAVGSSYKSTKNIGKLLQDASASGAKLAVIFAPAEWERGVVKVKDLVTREEREVAAAEVVGVVRGMVR